jgi:hypothetical protein
MEPFLAVRGKLQKDGATLNVIAHEVEALRVPGTPVPRRGLSRSYVAASATSERGAVTAGLGSRTEPEPKTSPFRYLTALRQSPPGIKSFG